MTSIKLFLQPMAGLPNCPCYVERTESGEIVSSDLNLCAFKIDRHWPALERGIARLKEINTREHQTQERQRADREAA